MANTTIYPFGVGGQTADGINIANDLATNAANQALSAAMGVELASQISDLENLIGSGTSMYFNDANNTLYISSTGAIPRLSVKRNGVRVTAFTFEETEYDTTKSVVLNVIGKDLTTTVTAAVTGSAFSASPTTFSPDASGNVNGSLTITFAPTSSTGTATQEGRQNEGTVTLTSDTASASFTLSGMGVEEVVPTINLSLDKNTIKGVVSGTTEYDATTAQAILTVTGSNLEGDISLALSDSVKFSLSQNTIAQADLANGGSVDVTVTYAQQSAATMTDDALTITATSTGASNKTASLTAATGTKKTSGNIALIDGIRYFFASSVVAIKQSTPGPSGDIVVPSYIFDDYGYKYGPVVSIEDNGFKSNTHITSFVSESICKLYISSFQGCTSLKTVKFTYTGSAGETVTRANLFNGCVSLESAEFGNFDAIGYRAGFFSGCIKLASLTLRYNGVCQHIAFDTTNDVFPLNQAGTQVVYTDIGGNEQQTTLYVPSSRVASYQADSGWSMFDIQAITE